MIINRWKPLVAVSMADAPHNLSLQEVSLLIFNAAAKFIYGFLSLNLPISKFRFKWKNRNRLNDIILIWCNQIILKFQVLLGVFRIQGSWVSVAVRLELPAALLTWAAWCDTHSSRKTTTVTLRGISIHIDRKKYITISPHKSPIAWLTFIM